MTDWDRNRKAFKQLMLNSGLYSNNIRRLLFDNFLTAAENSVYLQLYYLLCSGYVAGTELKQKFQQLTRAFDFVISGNYIYTTLFKLDPAWREFFKENAYPSGQNRLSEKRLGVDRHHVDRVHRIKNTGEGCNLEDAIVIDCQRKLEVQNVEISAVY